MHASKFQQKGRSPNRTRRTLLKIVLVYDGFTDLIRAHELWSGLVERFENEMQIVGRAWNFALLRDPRLRMKAALHTAEANMVILSASSQGKLPAHMQNWVNAWMPWKKGRRDALVAMVDHRRQPVVSALCQYLRQTAQQTGMDFFCNAQDEGPPMGLVAQA
jgi:hypothetical protein